MTQPSTISLERPTPRIATITFSNAPANLIVPETVIRLHEIVVDLSEDPDIQVLVFKSGLPDFFINHFDIAAAADFPGGTDDDAVPIWTDLVLRLSKAPFITIASIRGRTRGGGKRTGPGPGPAIREPREGALRPARGRQRPAARRRWDRATAPVRRPRPGPGGHPEQR